MQLFVFYNVAFFIRLELLPLHNSRGYDLAVVTADRRLLNPEGRFAVLANHG